MFIKNLISNDFYFLNEYLIKFNCVKLMMINYLINPKNIGKYFILLFLFFSFFVYNYFLFLIRFFFSFIVFFLIFYFLKSINFGNKIVLFFNESKFEISKVYWPSIRESVEITFVVFIFSFIFSMIVWVFDKFIFYIISIIIGLRL